MILRTLFSVLFLVGSSIIFSGCAINYLTEDRSFNGSVKDSEAEISLRNALFQKDQNYFADVSVIVAEKRALLTGSVDSSESIDEIVTIVNKNSYITDVYNHLTVNSNGSIKDSSMDLFLNKKIFAALVSTEGVTSANYKTVVKDRIAYIMGSTNSSKEKALALKAAREVSGLRKVVDYIIIID